MKRLIRFSFILAGLLLFSTNNANAQFSKVLKKVKKVAEQVLDTPSSTTTDNGLADSKEVKLENGGTMESSVADFVDIQLVGLYGESTSSNYGKAYLVLKVKMIANLQKIGIGTAANVQMLAVDEDGNSYKPYSSGYYSYDVNEGIYVKIEMNEDWIKFLDVKKSAKKMQMVRLGVWGDANHKGSVTFKNIPVIWDEEKQP